MSSGRQKQTQIPYGNDNQRIRFVESAEPWLRDLALVALLLMGAGLPVGLLAQDQSSGAKVPRVRARLPDFNRGIYYRNKLEFSVETGVLPVNLPFIFDVFTGGDYSQKPLHYTLVPVFPSLRWQVGNLNGPGFLRGNTDLTASLSVTAIPRGPEKV